MALIEACNPKIANRNIMRNSLFTQVSLAFGFGHGKPVYHPVTQSKKSGETGDYPRYRKGAFDRSTLESQLCCDAA